MVEKDLMVADKGWFSSKRVAQDHGKWRHLVALCTDPRRTSWSWTWAGQFAKRSSCRSERSPARHWLITEVWITISKYSSPRHRIRLLPSGHSWEESYFLRILFVLGISLCYYIQRKTVVMPWSRWAMLYMLVNIFLSLYISSEPLIHSQYIVQKYCLVLYIKTSVIHLIYPYYPDYDCQVKSPVLSHCSFNNFLLIIDS